MESKATSIFCSPISANGGEGRFPEDAGLPARGAIKGHNIPVRC